MQPYASSLYLQLPCNPTAPARDSVHLSCNQAASPFTQAGDQSRNDLFRQYGVQILEALPNKPNVLLLTHGDEVRCLHDTMC